ncbi:hypothetical protein P3X46_006215 [Hevea brasiliensis]|uniref:Uncharacterized protein n=1 Tax=Hevea brasiliensis TaxID=3981 RepID=A0ABQ9MPH4_HEVBR|nr:protein LIKE EARLY STARVATION, chloroplastic [Hevea brasiliensis]KAJ9182192.1 hypothetical protein P3X46_006215 [Hevea brasiliensis]
MASKLGACSRATTRYAHFQKTGKPLFLPLEQSLFADKSRTRIVGSSRIRASNDGNSYLDMWKNAVDRDKKTVEFQRITERVSGTDNGNDADNDGGWNMNLEKKSEDFKKILDVSKEERDRTQRMQVIDRAAAAIAAARAILKDRQSGNDKANDDGASSNLTRERGGGAENNQDALNNGSVFPSPSETSGNGVPGPDFWSWTPPPGTEKTQYDADLLEAKRSLISPILASPVAMKERCLDFLNIPLESKLSESSSNPPIPPLQSLMEVKKEEVSISSPDMPSLKEEEQELNLLFHAHELEAAYVLDEVDDEFSGVDPNGSRWWKETGIEQRPDGVICRWTMTRGASADQDVEWQEKFWEASDEFGYKELGSEKSGRDATGNVWREYWRESMWQESGLMHMEKTADKWGKNGRGDEWKEEWWEHYDASNQAEKWAHKWCTVDPTTRLEAGHAHVWHERWGEKYDGHGGTIKYTDKWAERCEGDCWTKWGDKWDEHFDPNGRGVKQGETWWEGKQGERWNRTWGERHNCSGWVHKYGKSSSGEHWDTHVAQETWYERFPHFGFYHCFDNSIQLREVPKPSDRHEVLKPSDLH